MHNNTVRRWALRLATVAAWAAVWMGLSGPAYAQQTQAACFFENRNYGGRTFCTNAATASVPSTLAGRVSAVRLLSGTTVDLFATVSGVPRTVRLTASNADLRSVGFDNLTQTYTVTVAPKPCAAASVSWVASGNTCNATVSAVASGVSVTAADTTAPTTGQATYQCTNGTWSAPTAASCTAPPPTGPTVQQQRDAARLLSQASFGPTLSEINSAAALGPTAWLQQQFAATPMDTHLAYVARGGAIGCSPCTSGYINAVMESIWHQYVKSPDQLRQRTVFALSEIFVVSAVNSSIETIPEAHAGYLDMLSRNAFGNFRTLLEQVALSPAMGVYLSHFRNMKEDPATGRVPDENFAREVMQLFTIGLWELNEDGTRRKDANLQDIPTYGLADVVGLAKVFTGLSWGGPDKSYDRWMSWLGYNFRDPMQFYPDFTSTAEKRFLGTSIPAGTSGEESLRRALDTLFQHRNVGPFIGRQLIQRLVTSNPSPAYVARVARVFNNNGAGVRGDMKAVVQAILLDDEARNPTVAAGLTYGKVREPIVRFAHWMRAFNATAQSAHYRIWNVEDTVTSLGQNPQRAPSVFNWFRPNYAPPGEVLARGLVAPEFQITHETTVSSWANFVVGTVASGFGWNADAIRGNYTAELALASDPAALLNHLDLVLTQGQMSANTRNTILQAVQAVPASDPTRRVHMAVALVLVSQDYLIQR